MTIKLIWCSAKVVRHKSLNIIWLDFEPKQSPSLAVARIVTQKETGGEKWPKTALLWKMNVFLLTLSYNVKSTVLFWTYVTKWLLYSLSKKDTWGWQGTNWRTSLFLNKSALKIIEVSDVEGVYYINVQDLMWKQTIRVSQWNMI